MRKNLIIIYILLSFFISCKSETITGPDFKGTDYVTKKTSAVFKNAELVFGDEWKIVFRKLDDYQYIVFSNNVDELNSFNYRFITMNPDNSYRVNTDFMNIRFEIDYIETTVTDPATDDDVLINRIVNISRIPGGRYAAAGIESDVDADDFIMNLKEMARTGDAESISELIAYPVTVYIKNRKTRVTSAQMFVKNYSEIFNEKVTVALNSQSLGNITADKKGIIIGKGEIRISLKNGQFVITEINNR